MEVKSLGSCHSIISATGVLNYTWILSLVQDNKPRMCFSDRMQAKMFCTLTAHWTSASIQSPKLCWEKTACAEDVGYSFSQGSHQSSHRCHIPCIHSADGGKARKKSPQACSFLWSRATRSGHESINKGRPAIALATLTSSPKHHLHTFTKK